MSLRITAGEKRRTLLASPPSLATRPTGSRVRESLFMILGESVRHAHVLDAFAGTGVLGLEALSRGARKLVLIESAHSACTATRENIARLGYGDRARLIRRDAVRALNQPPPPEAPFHVLLFDPPYAQNLAWHALERLARHADQWVRPDGVIVFQLGRQDPLPPEAGPLVRDQQRDYRETRLDFYRMGAW